MGKCNVNFTQENRVIIIYSSQTLFYSRCSDQNEKTKCIKKGHPIYGTRATHGSLKGYLWLSMNLPEFPFHFCVIIFKKKYYRSECVLKCLLNY